MRIFSNSILIIIGFNILIVLSSGCVSIGGFVQELNMDDNPDNFTELNKTANGTYSVAGVSFKCPDNWSVITDNMDGEIIIAASPIHESNIPVTKSFGPFKVDGFASSLSSADPQFEVSITPSNGMSEQEAINQVRTENSALGSKISSEKITIDGENAFKDVVLFNDTDERFEYIYFVKNGKTYLITFSAADKDFDKEKANFDMILNSFNIQ